MTDLKIVVGDEEFEASWSDENPETREAIEEALPMEGSANKWGKEYYFSIPVDVAEENSRKKVEKGSLAYWPQGNAFCIFWGETPAGMLEAASPVNVFGEIEDWEGLDECGPSPEIRVEKIE
jgi:hypothetical protein